MLRRAILVRREVRDALASTLPILSVLLHDARGSLFMGSATSW